MEYTCDNCDKTFCKSKHTELSLFCDYHSSGCMANIKGKPPRTKITVKIILTAMVGAIGWTIILGFWPLVFFKQLPNDYGWLAGIWVITALIWTKIFRF